MAVTAKNLNVILMFIVKPLNSPYNAYRYVEFGGGKWVITLLKFCLAPSPL